MALTAQRGGLVGEPKSFRFTLTATPNVDRTLAKTVQGEFVHKPWLRSWKPILMPLVILLVLGALLLGFRSIPWNALGFGSEAATVTNIFSSLWCRVPFVCPPEKEKPYYKEGFKAFHDQNPDLIGDPLVNEVPDAVGNTYQLTANGTLVWFKAASRPYFFGPEGVYQLAPDGRIRRIDAPPAPR